MDEWEREKGRDNVRGPGLDGGGERVSLFNRLTYQIFRLHK